MSDCLSVGLKSHNFPKAGKCIDCNQPDNRVEVLIAYAEAVGELHYPVNNLKGGKMCEQCSRNRFIEDTIKWPCPTAKLSKLLKGDGE